MKTYGIIALLCLGFFSKSWALDYGIGVSLKSYDNSIYLPIKLTNSIFVEPYFRQQEYSSSYGSGSNSSEEEEVGLGFFAKVTEKNNMSIYYGLRGGYVEQIRKHQYVSDKVIEKNSGYRIGPIIGFEYILFESLSFGAEAEYYKTKLDGSTKDSVSTDKTRYTTKGTDTRIIVRYFFQ